MAVSEAVGHAGRPVEVRTRVAQGHPAEVLLGSVGRHCIQPHGARLSLYRAVTRPSPRPAGTGSTMREARRRPRHVSGAPRRSAPRAGAASSAGA
jgi:hypothetical protein